MGQLFDELKRRNVFRVAVAYLIAAWLVLQVADLVLENISAPDWVMQVFMLLFALGFPLVLIFSWAYELTPEGLKREKDVDRSRSVTQETGKKLNQITIGLLVVVVLIVVAERLLVPHAADSEAPARVGGTPDRSIAVLAFEDLSQDGDQEYFADGLSEELLNVLAQNPALQVAGRTSSFAFKGQNKDLREIGELLNVAHILEGSVRKAGNRIRVTAQLINAEDGYHLFSESYDRDLTDLFAVQDELAARISEALHTELIGTESVQEVTESEIAAYDLYLAAREKIHSRDPAEMYAAIDLLERALDMDADYAPAMAQKALAVFLLSDNEGSYGDIPTVEAVATARPLVNRALELDPRLAEAHAISALIMDAENVDVNERIKLLRHALDMNPSLDNARNWLSSNLGEAGRDEESLALLESIVERDPMFGPAFNNLVTTYSRTRQFDKANSLIGRVERIVGETSDVKQAWGNVAFNQGRHAEAIRHLRMAYADNPNATIVRVFYRLALERVGETEKIVEIGDPDGRIIALLQTGQPEEAMAIVDSFIAADDLQEVLSATAYGLVLTGDYERLVKLVNDHYDSLDALLAEDSRVNSLSTGYMGPLAHAYRELGMDAEFTAVVTAMDKAIEAQIRRSPQFGPVLYGRWQRAALAGDREALLENARKIADQGTADVQAFNDPIFRAYEDDAEFQAIVAEIVKRGNDERAKLGLEPFNPLETTSL